MKHLSLIYLFGISCLLSVTQLIAEENDVEVLTVEDVGRYAPEETPNLEKVREQFVQRTNRFRKENKQTVLNRDETLDDTAQIFAEFMAESDRYGHSADGRDPNERTYAQGYRHCQIAENIGYFFRTVGYATDELAKEAVQGWVNSPGHRENMLLEHTTQIGVGIAQSKSTHVFYAVQLFGRPRSLMINFSVENKTQAEISYQLGEKTFSLEPRYTRTHGICQPQKLLIGNEESNKDYQPQGGEKYSITTQAEELEIQITQENQQQKDLK